MDMLNLMDKMEIWRNNKNISLVYNKIFHDIIDISLYIRNIKGSAYWSNKYILGTREGQ